MIKHDTASTFVFCPFTDGWRLGLIKHPRLRLHMIPGGYVEDDENHEQAAIREVTEETGLVEVRLVAVPAPGLPEGYPHPPVAREWWKTEIMVPADNHVAEPHVHIDHQYLAVIDSPSPVHEPQHAFGWFAVEELSRLAMPEDTRLLAEHLFPCIAELAAGTLDEAAVLRSFATAETQ